MRLQEQSKQENYNSLFKSGNSSLQEHPGELWLSAGGIKWLQFSGWQLESLSGRAAGALCLFDSSQPSEDLRDGGSSLAQRLLFHAGAEVLWCLIIAFLCLGVQTLFID